MIFDCRARQDRNIHERLRSNPSRWEDAKRSICNFQCSLTPVNLFSFFTRVLDVSRSTYLVLLLHQSRFAYTLTHPWRTARWTRSSSRAEQSPSLGMSRQLTFLMSSSDILIVLLFNIFRKISVSLSHFVVNRIIFLTYSTLMTFLNISHFRLPNLLGWRLHVSNISALKSYIFSSSIYSISINLFHILPFIFAESNSACPDEII